MKGQSTAAAASSTHINSSTIPVLSLRGELRLMGAWVLRPKFVPLSQTCTCL